MIKAALILLFAMVAAFALDRPTNDWRVIYREQGVTKAESLQAEGVDEALYKFRRRHRKAEDLRVVGVCQISYVSCQ